MLVKRITIILALMSGWLPFTSIAQPQDGPVKKVSCNKGIRHIETLSLEFLVVRKLDMVRQRERVLLDYLVACHKESRGYSVKRREEFINIIQRILDRIEMAERSLLIEKPAEVKEIIGEYNNVKMTLMITKAYLQEEIPIDKGWGRGLITNFYLGYEGTTVSGLQSKGTERVGVLIYNELFEDLNIDRRPGLHLFGTVMLTSSAEQSGSDAEEEIVPAIDLNINTYIPWAVKQLKGAGLVTMGPLFSIGLRKADNSDIFTRKGMGGLRISHSPEAYFDLLYGRTGGVKGDRIELRGQLPVGVALKGDILIGGVVNLNSKVIEPGEEITEKNRDTMRLYATWQVTFSDVFSLNR